MSLILYRRKPRFTLAPSLVQGHLVGSEPRLCLHRMLRQCL